MKIGTLSKAVSCHVETVRYYEKEGLLPPATRAANGYGEYSDTHLKLLRLIRHAKGLGFSQIQTRELVGLTRKQDNACDEVHKLTLEQLSLIAEKLKALRKMQKTLKDFSSTCERNQHADCPVLEHLVSDNE